MADTIKKIGATNTPTTMDYSTLQSWEDALPANLVTDAHRQIGEVYNQGELTSATLNISGATTDASNYILLRTATGASFRDHANVRTNPLDYDATKGAAATGGGNYGPQILIDVEFTRIQNLQFKDNGLGTAIDIRQANVRLENLISRSAGTQAWYFRYHAPVVNNCAFISSGGTGIFETHASDSVNNCTIVHAGGGGTTGASGNPYGPGSNFNNCAFFGWTTPIFDGGSAGDYNATDAGSITGAHSVTSLTFANQFVSTTVDFRAVITGGLKAGTPDATNAPTDITGFTRDATTPYIGAWEVAGGGGAAFMPRKNPMRGQAVKRASEW